MFPDVSGVDEMLTKYRDCKWNEKGITAGQYLDLLWMIDHLPLPENDLDFAVLQGVIRHLGDGKQWGVGKFTIWWIQNIMIGSSRTNQL